MNKALFEIGLEEIPSSEYEKIYSQLQSSFEEIFKKLQINYTYMNIFIAPRRFGIFFEGISDSSPDTIEEIKGPPKKLCFDSEKKPTKVLEGFIKKNGIDYEKLFSKSLKDVEYIFAKIEKKGEKTETILNRIIPEITLNIKFNKPMKWGFNKEFVRPIHWVLGLYNDKILNFEIFGKTSSNITYGHRTFGKKETILNCDDYFKKMEENFVVCNIAKRKEKIINELENVKKEYNFDIDFDENLIVEIAKLTEFPTAVVGEFKEKYLSLPEELIVTTVKHHQRSFIAKKDGKITNKYISFQDGYGREENVKKGYSRVINARLDDAYFYFKDDIIIPVENRLKELEKIIYQKELGTYKEKIEKIQLFSEIIAAELGYNSFDTVKRAALLSKIDIPSKIVFEFPEIQGKMAKIYLKSQNEPSEIYTTAYDHYKPTDENDSISSCMTANIISIADKIDDIISFFSIGKIPTGSKDPFALRRKAFGIFRILIEKEMDINLIDIIEKFKKNHNISFDYDSLNEFMKNRFESLLAKEKISTEIINSVSINWKKPLRAFISAKALSDHLNKDEFKQFVSAFQRVYNITKNHNGNEYNGRLFKKTEEKILFEKYLETKAEYEKFLSRIDYSSAINVLIQMKPEIDNFFDNIFVMDKDESIRLNRLNFLKVLSNMFLEIGDITNLYT